MSWFSGTRARLRLLFSGEAADRRMDEEIRFHIEMETERLVREGVERGEAERRALVAFGGVERTREELRAGRGWAWLSGLRLDVKLGLRMLLKYPVLTAASVLSLTVAVTLAASWFEFTRDMTVPTLPIPGGDRLVLVENRDLETAAVERRSLHDFETWRSELRSIEDLTAATAARYTVVTDRGRFATLDGMRVTPSMFRLARVAPLFGRVLTDADAEPGAPPVAVLEFAAWQRVFDGDPSVVGRSVELGGEHATVVGVMPDGFGFPVNEEVWTTLRARSANYERREGPPLTIMGRLTPGATIEDARTELAVIGQRTAEDHPVTHERLRPVVRRPGQIGSEATIAALLNVPFILLLIVVSANVAALLFARTARREGEIAMRSALGASRTRIVLQLVAEALVLTGTGAVLGLVVAGMGREWVMTLFFEVQEMRPPFWFDYGLSVSTVLYVLALAVLGAVIVGGMPSLRATGRHLRQRLTQPAAGGAGMKFGRVATGVIIVQVALCVAFIPVAVIAGRDLLPEGGDSPFPASSYLTMQLAVDQDPGAGTAPPPAAGRAERAAQLLDEARRRLAAESGVVAATRADRLPGFNHPSVDVEVERDTARAAYARRLAVDPDFFATVGARIVSGRSFRDVDVGSDNRVAVVDAEWARAWFPDGSPVGQRIRFPAASSEAPQPWYEVVGVVSGMKRMIGPGADVGVYVPLRPEEHHAVRMFLRTEAPPASLGPRVHSLVSSLGPNLIVADVEPLAETWRPVERAKRLMTVGLIVVALIILLFALIGIYALMSFTVAQRAREIGIRAAMGADPRRILVSIFSRAMTQIGVGIVAGATLVSFAIGGDPGGVQLVVSVALAVAAVGLVGSAIPAARALRIQPVDALRAE